jgi:TPR repeat protein
MISNAEAQYKLSFMCQEGQGVPQDHVTAYMWFNLSAAGAYQKAQEARDGLAQRMTREQIAEGQRLSREWKPNENRRPQQGNVPGRRPPFWDCSGNCSDSLCGWTATDCYAPSLSHRR